MSTFTSQAGISAFGTTSHSYLEFDLTEQGLENQEEAIDLALDAVAASMQTGTAVMTVIGFRPEFWASSDYPAIQKLEGFNRPVVGLDGFSMPATQHDLVLWIHGGAMDAVFNAGADLTQAISQYFKLENADSGWVYQHNRDLTGFVDGTENPSPLEIPEVIQDETTGGSVLLLQKWPHEGDKWLALSTEEQEAVIGRTKDTDVELEDRPVSSHVARNDQEDLGDILRRNTAFGDVATHGTMFVGIAAKRETMQVMLDRMAGKDGVRDALTFFSHADTGAYYYLPPQNILLDHLPEEEED
ncbi:hypothetical protein BK816_03125 [Boudabousia tangfeifanii]|uniref:Dyp-type peroxidase C-terminal domain-containing protein n=1 Tax=Boudabousia tangfeifanii TaxID=1912795 RepID=A0A1D9MJM2_9ACTO|nr:Dyp-type peroxidase [Boudabousia tangfeifanii]AOZ72408.1 hypothetical protein BK816_03125 [Boudabousia tangfeifanii]